jgi:sialidase-1
MTTKPFFEQVDVFQVEGADVHRIPSLVVSNQGTVLAFCNRRISSAADSGHDTDLVLRRSLDDGRTWGPYQVLFARPGWASGIGNAVVDRRSGAIMLIYGRSPTDPLVNERSHVEGTRVPPEHPDAGAFIQRSHDDGVTWQEERLVLRPNALGLRGSAHGGGPALQIHYSPYEGRLVMPARTWTKPVFDLTRYTHNCVIYSDDGGATWQTSGLVQSGTGEACIVETIGGALCVNSRAYHRLGRRYMAWSYDGGESFAQFGWAEMLTDTLPHGVNASMIRYSDAVSGERPRILFANPASETRERMTVRVSYDECQTWPVARLIHEGPAAYSTLGVSPSGTILCFYERGAAGPYEKMTVARFNIQWLEQA